MRYGIKCGSESISLIDDDVVIDALARSWKGSMLDTLRLTLSGSAWTETFCNFTALLITLSYT